MPDYEELDLDAVTYAEPEHRLLRSRGGSRSSSRSYSSRSYGSRSYTKTTTYRKTYYRPSSYRSRYYYSGYRPSTLMVAYVGFYAHPAAYWSVYSNRGGWGASCLTGLHCRSGCCSSEKLSSYSYSYSAAGAFCLNYAQACGYGAGGGGGSLIGAIVGLFFLCFCCIAAWFICKNCNGGADHSGSEHGSEHVVEEVVVEEKIVEEIHHDDGPPQQYGQPGYGGQMQPGYGQPMGQPGMAPMQPGYQQPMQPGYQQPMG